MTWFFSLAFPSTDSDLPLRVVWAGVDSARVKQHDGETRVSRQAPATRRQTEPEVPDDDGTVLKNIDEFTDLGL